MICFTWQEKATNIHLISVTFLLYLVTNNKGNIMNLWYFRITLPRCVLTIAIPQEKLCGESSVMTNAEQQGLITAEECDSIDWNVQRLSEAEYNRANKVMGLA